MCIQLLGVGTVGLALKDPDTKMGSKELMVVCVCVRVTGTMKEKPEVLMQGIVGGWEGGLPGSSKLVGWGVGCSLEEVLFPLFQSGRFPTR